MTETFTRRQYLGATGSVAFLGLNWGSLAENEDLEDVLEYEDGIPLFPEHITDVRADTEELEDYQPRLVTLSQEARTDMAGMYGWSCESEDYDVTAHYYWIRSNTQRSILSWTGFDVSFMDSHYLDHEPILIFTNPDGTVEKTVQSGGHHLAFEIDGEFGNLVEDRVSDRRTHVVLRQMRPHNHFMEASTVEDGGWVQFYADFGSWLDLYETWFRNGRYSNTSDVAVMDPFTFYDSDGRTHWWREGTMDAWMARNIYVRRLAIGDEREHLRFED